MAFFVFISKSPFMKKPAPFCANSRYFINMVCTHLPGNCGKSLNRMTRLFVLSIWFVLIESSFAARVGDILNRQSKAIPGSIKVVVSDDVDSVTLEYRKSSKSAWTKSTSKVNPAGSREVTLTIPSNLQMAETRVVVTKLRPVPAGLKFSKSTGAASVSLAQTPVGKKVALEAFDKTSKSWKRVSLAEASTPGGSVKINVPKGNRSSELRVVAVDPTKPSTIASKFPDIFRKGKTSFEGPEVKQNSASEIYPTGVLSSESSRVSDLKTANTNTVEEADIWRVLGKRIYFFNQLRGLQVIDTTDTASPEIVSSLRMPAVGEDMYVLSQNRVLLVRRDYSGEWKTFAVLIDCSSPSASILSKVELPGWYSDSRMINGRLVIATQSWNYSTYAQTGILSVVEDVATAPRVAGSKEFDHSLSTMGVGSDYLWVAGSNWWDWNKTNLSLLRIDTLPSLNSSIRVSVQGHILDKFKVHQNGNALFAITQSWASNWRGITKLESFSLANEVATPAATLTLVEGESLHATRFDGDKAYAVTFRNVDPLWIIDISDVADPKIVSELQVPGWSSYIQPVGDCLAAVGVEGGKVVASLFDVSDSTNPTLASRVEVGGDKNWTWSEANWNEKAVAILPDQNLILLPYQSWNWGNAADSAVQIIDLNAAGKTLTKRGVIKHAFQPRRATALEQGILASISNRELLLVDASDRDNPSVLSDSVLAFGADRILFANDKFLVHAEDADWGSDYVTVRVSDASDPENILAEANLLGARVLAAGVQGNRLAIATLNTKSPDKSSFLVYHVDALPELVEAGRTTPDFSGISSYGSRTNLLWPTSDLAVLSSVDSGWWWPRPIAFEGDFRIAECGIPGRWSANEGVKLFPFDLSESQPKACPPFDLSTQNFQNTSTMFAVDGLIVFSAQKCEQVTLKKTAPTLTTIRLPQPFVLPRTLLNHYLSVVDFADPSAPALWPQTSIPGTLEGIADFDRSAGIVITSQPKADSTGETLTALLYESGVASSISSFDLKSGQPKSVIGRSVYSADTNSLTLRTLENSGSFSLKGSITNLPWNPLEIRAEGGFVKLRNGREVGLIDSLLANDLSVWSLDSWLFWNLTDAHLFGDSIAIPLRDFGLEILK